MDSPPHDGAPALAADRTLRAHFPSTSGNSTILQDAEPSNEAVEGGNTHDSSILSMDSSSRDMLAEYIEITTHQLQDLHESLQRLELLLSMANM